MGGYENKKAVNCFVHCYALPFLGDNWLFKQFVKYFIIEVVYGIMIIKLTSFISLVYFVGISIVLFVIIRFGFM